MNNTLLVSVVMITYGHENYIRQAIEGVLMQECDFEVELIVANDSSPDQTDAVIQNILENHPRAPWIRYIKHERNLGMMPNFIFALQQAKSKYVALCEGDDYWTDFLKLQKQVDFLENNPDYVLCFHPVKVWQEGNIIEDTITTKVSETTTTTIYDLAKGNYIHTCSVVYRNKLFKEFPAYYKKAPVGDYFLHLLNARHGAIKCFEDYMGVYRVHNISYWSSKTQTERELIWVPFLKKMKPYFNKEVQEILDSQIAIYNKSDTINIKLKNRIKLWLKSIKL